MPVSRESYLRRIDALASRLRSLGADGAFATPSSNLFYLSGIDFHRSERLTALFVFRDRDPVVVCPSFEAARLKGMSAVSEVRTWEETEDPFALAASLFPAGSGTLAVEPSTAFDDVERLLKARTGWKAVSAAPAFAALRMVKTAEEIEAIRRAIATAVPRFAEAFASLAVGTVEADVSRRFGGDNVVQFGPSSALPHGASGPRALARGEAVLIDAWDRPEGYYYDITRSTFSGRRPTSTARSGRSSSRRRRRRSRRRRRASPARRWTRRRAPSSNAPGYAESLSRTAWATASESTSTSLPTWSATTARSWSPA